MSIIAREPLFVADHTVFPYGELYYLCLETERDLRTKDIYTRTLIVFDAGVGKGFLWYNLRDISDLLTAFRTFCQVIGMDETDADAVGDFVEAIRCLAQEKRSVFSSFINDLQETIRALLILMTMDESSRDEDIENLIMDHMDKFYNRVDKLQEDCGKQVRREEQESRDEHRQDHERVRNAHEDLNFLGELACISSRYQELYDYRLKEFTVTM